jgi:thiamine-monophosphate kinase
MWDKGIIMDEFALINTFFKSIPSTRNDVVFGIGDDAACLNVPSGYQLLVSTDSLLADVHFCSTWDAYDIACKCMMVNVSDIAAMGGLPCWVSLALTLPTLEKPWLQRFAQGLRDSLACFNMALIGGDTTRGSLSITLTIHGLVPSGKAVQRKGAKSGDKIYVSGELGAAALAVSFLSNTQINNNDKAVLMDKLQHPVPRVDLSACLQAHASAAIDISDGLSADLNHICVASGVGACLFEKQIPIHPLLEKYEPEKALDFALKGGDDYELCFTIPAVNEPAFLADLNRMGLHCYPMGVIETSPGMRMQVPQGEIIELNPAGYRHF